MTLTATPAPAVPASPPPRPGRTGLMPRLLSRTAVNGVLVIATLYTLMPLLWLVMASTKDMRDLFGTNGFAFGQEFNLGANLSHLFTANDGIYLEWLWNTVLYAGGGALVATALCVAAGYAFDKLAFPFKEKIFGLILLGVLVPASAMALPIYLLASKVGLVNTFWGFFLPSLVFPFGVYLARVFSAAYVPDEVVEATRVDGAGDLRTFVSIGFPMLRTAFVTIFLFQFTSIWNGFYLPLVMLTDQHLYPLNLGLYTWQTTGLNQGHPEDYLLAITGSLVAVIPLIIAFVALQRYWKAGMTTGAVK
ncbi:sugar ABC transporter permease [Microtetraspora sp. NBRC 13810]|uniref:carbohydrate ABC transporter permease n=1 Tax=Microtetraspora sp. NBRC 13810 TaxID=3030990 RepID=UPI0024A3C344|nr:carbohydrate ABC transporter permease [Microtetraspora sp. NBRC 13810]GLW05182.1 sugar ABC transporter permease [Microtetraspora sp. NBRC 13810]